MVENYNVLGSEELIPQIDVASLNQRKTLEGSVKKIEIVKKDKPNYNPNDNGDYFPGSL